MLFWCHLAAGVTAGVVILVMSATGVLLTYEKQMLAWSAGSRAVAPPAAGAPRLPLDTLLARAEAAAGGAGAASATVSSDPAAPVMVALADRRTFHLDPYTGRVLGDDARLRAFFSEVQRWHRSMAIGTGMRSPTGTMVTGASNLLFLFLLLSGLYLWWPRRLTARAFRAVTLPRLRGDGRARDWNWHHVAGFWTAPVLLVLVVSATFFSYQWPQKLVNRLAGAPAQAEERGKGEAPKGEGAPKGGERGKAEGGGGARPEGGTPGGAPVKVANLEGLFATAARQEAGWKTIQARLPREEGAAVTFAIARTSTMRPDLRSTVELDAESGAVRKVQRYADGDAGRRVRSWMRYLHTGEVAGFWGQTVAGLASLAGVVLVWTGIALALRRLRSWTRRRTAAA